MAKHTNTSKLNIPMCIAAFLLCLTLISTHFTSGLYAKYITRDSGSDSARVISFGDITITETGDFYEENKLMIVPGVDLTKKAVVDFEGSESATYVFVEIIPSDGIAAADGKSFTVSLGGKSAMEWSVANGWTFLRNHYGSYVYYRELSPNEKLDGADIIADNGKITVNEAITKSEIESLRGFSIKLRATVLQSGGFEGPETAWSSVAGKGGNW